MNTLASKEKIVKYLQKVRDEISYVLDEVMIKDNSIENIDLENMQERVQNMIDELEEINDFETSDDFYLQEDETIDWDNDEDDY